MKTKKPLLSIGIIFRDDIRCIERCLKSLRPLRDAVPCELVMADTGSVDGSREVAERYADILIDFPWVNDFAAARNAVMDRCSGEWYFSIDTDEWLDGSFGPLVQFLRDPVLRRENRYLAVMVRNYSSEDRSTRYNDFLAARLVRMSSGERYKGAIHEKWSMRGEVYALNRVLLHHDGYVDLNGEKGRAKRDRNMSLLKEKLKEDPEDLLTLIHCFESSDSEKEGVYARQAFEALGKKPEGWKLFGPSICRNAVSHAYRNQLPEVEEYAARAWEWFPKSIFTTVDVSFIMLLYYAKKEEYEKTIFCGEQYFPALAAYRQGGQGIAELISGALAMVAPVQEQAARVLLADAYFHVKEFQKSADTLAALDGAELDREDARNATGALMNLHAQSGMDMRERMAALWERMSLPQPTPEWAEKRKAGMAEVAARCFERDFRNGETGLGYRHAYTLFTPLEGQCAEGDAAAMLETDDPVELTEKLASAKDLARLPAGALAHALGRGAALPPLDMELMDVLAARLRGAGDTLYQLACTPVPAGDLRAICWARALAMSAVRGFPWTEKEGGMALARSFADVERAFLPVCYAPDALTEGALFLLPPMHRFGWYCAQAFEAKDAGRAAECVRLLRKGLETAPEMKPMVEFLLEQIEREQRETAIASAPPELLELAEQVRGILKQYPPDDPAVREIKNSPMYQKVAYLIEEPATPGLGGIRQ